MFIINDPAIEAPIKGVDILPYPKFLAYIDANTPIAPADATLIPDLTYMI